MWTILLLKNTKPKLKGKNVRQAFPKVNKTIQLAQTVFISYFAEYILLNSLDTELNTVL